MTIKELVNKLELYTPEGFSFWSSLHKDHYNSVKQVNDTYLVVFPNPYPSQWRPGCSHNVDVEIWLGGKVGISRPFEAEYQENPYSSINVVQNMHVIANSLIANISTDEYLSVLTSSPYEFFDSPDGASVNSQIWLKFKLTLKAWYVAPSESITYVTFKDIRTTFDNKLITT